MNRRVSTLGLVALLGATACSSDGSSGPSTKKNPVDSGTTTAGFKLTWAIADATAFSIPDSGTPDASTSTKTSSLAQLPGLAGVNVCVREHPEIACAVSAADGSFELDDVPPLANLVITLLKDGYIKEIKVVQTASTDMQVTTGSILMYQLAKAAVAPGVTQDPTKGSIDFFAIGPIAGSTDPNSFQTEPGVTVTLSPSTAEGPFFQNGAGKFETSTTTLNGFGFFYNVEPGDYTLTFTHPQFDCAPLSITLSAWGIPKPPKSVEFSVLPGYLTDEVGVFCTQKSVLVGVDGG